MKTLKQLSLATAAAATPLIVVIGIVMASAPQPVQPIQTSVSDLIAPA